MHPSEKAIRENKLREFTVEEVLEWNKDYYSETRIWLRKNPKWLKKLSKSEKK